MKLISKYVAGSITLIAALLLAVSCSSEYEYMSDYSAYKNVKLKVNLVDESNTLRLKMANGTHQITMGVVPEEIQIDLKAYFYEVSDPTVATVSQDGVLTLLSAGRTQLTVKFRGNQEISTTCTLEVEPTLISDLKIVEASIAVEEGKVLDLKEYITILPSNAGNKVLRYEIKEGSAEYVTLVDGTVSVFKGLQKGEAIIIVSTTDGSNISKELTLHVTGKIPVTEIKLNNAATLSGKTVGIGQVFDLGSAITVMPANASDQELEFELVLGEGVASIDDKGILKTLAAGAVKVKVSAKGGTGITSEVSLTVSAAITAFERSLWTVKTSGNYPGGMDYVPDGSTGKPTDLLDGKTNTYLSLRKPEYFNYKDKDYAALNKEIFFIVDMGGEHEFNSFVYQHRNLNNLLAAQKISVSGSNDGVTFESIGEFDTPYQTSALSFSLSTIVKYRYVKVQPVLWSLTNGSSGTSIQTAEFNVEKK